MGRTQSGQLIRRIAPLAAVALLAVPAGANASTKSQTVSFAGNGVIGSATAKCKSGQRATGGGFLVTPGRVAPDFLFTHVFESQKSGQKSWRVSAQIQDSNAPADAVQLTAYVYCSSSASKTKTKTATATSAGGVIQPTPKCGSGQKAQAGGFSTGPPVVGGSFHSAVLDSIRSGNKRWLTTATQIGAANPLTANSFVYCADDSAPKASSPGTVTKTTLGTPASVDSRACNHRQPVSGAFTQAPQAQTSRILINESRKVGKAWRVSGVVSQSTATPITLRATAYCT